MIAHKVSAVSLLLLTLSVLPQIARGDAAGTLTATGGTPQSTVIGTAFAAALEVTLKDSGGAAVSGVTVTFAAPASGASATFSGTTAITNTSGIASVTATANSTAGSYSVVAIAGTLSAIFTLTNTTTGQPATLTATGGASQSTLISTAFSAPLQATLKDSGGNPISGITVNFAAPVSGASASLSSNSAITDASGIASVNATANGTAGSYSVMAIAGTRSATFSLTNTSADAGSVVATGGTPQSTLIGTPFSIPLQATVKDSGGTPVSGATVTFAVPSSGASASLSSGTATTNGSGVASVSAIANSTAGEYTVTASVGGHSASFALTNTGGGQASLTATGGTPQSTVVSTAFSAPLQATVKDSGGNPVSGVTVTFAAPSSGASASLSSTTAVTNSSGIASVTATANSIAGGYTVTATAGALSASFSLTNTTTATPASVTPTGGTPQSTAVGTPFVSTLQAIVKDAGGNPIGGVTLTFAAPSSGASAILSSTTAVTNTSGIASVTAIANNTAGGYTVTASTGALSATFSLINTGGTAASMTATGGTPQSALVGTSFAAPLQVTVKDANSNPVSGVTVTFTPPLSGASAGMSSGTAVTNSSGIASITVTANGAPGSYLVTATTGTLSATFALSNTTAVPAGITASGGTPQSAQVGKVFATPLQATVRDAGGNPVGGVTVTFAVPASGATAVLSSTTAVTNAAGVAGVSATANAISGGYLVTASVPGFTTTFSLTNLSTSVATLTAAGGASQAAIMTTQFASPLRVVVYDANGLPVNGVTVRFTAPASGASAALSSATAVTNILGSASVTATANTIAGNFTVTASVGELSATFYLANIAGPAAIITSTRGTPQSAALGAAFALPLQVKVRDSLGNPVAGASVFFTVPTVGASAAVSAGMVSTNSEGIASVTATANTIPGSYLVTAIVDSLGTLFALTNVGSGPYNLALGRTATQSTTLPGYPTAAASSAVDGIYDGSFYHGSVTATNLETSPWWQVDLNAGATINSIVIFNRTDCCGTRLNDYWVFISNTPFLATDTPGTLQNRAATYSSHQITAPGPSTTIDTGGVQGRYVRVQLGGTDYLSLAEIQVMGTGGGPASDNLSAGKAASQSSTLAGYSTSGAASAVDGSTDGSFFNGSVTATNTEAAPWWQVDLGASAAVSSVVVWNRTDCCGTRLNDYWIFVSDTPFLATDTPGTLQNRAGTFASHQATAPDGSATISTTGAQGRYVRIQLSGTNFLSLAEVQVFGTGGATPDTTNVAQGKTADQSSTLPGYPSASAASAVDGSTGGSFYGGSVATTDFQTSPWWQVDLGASKAVSSVVVWNRTDCCGTRLNDYWVFVSDTPFLATDTPATLQSRAGTFSSRQTTAPGPSASIEVSAQGRYVRVQLSGQNYLSLAEVQVLGQ